jgi:hypothetical protein
VVAGVVAGRHLVADGLEHFRPHLPRIVGDNARAELYDDGRHRDEG